LPDGFHWLLGEGAAALAEVGDLYTQTDMARQSTAFQAFWHGVQRVKYHVDNLTREHLGPIDVDPDFGMGHFSH